jgi:hypothetical protein
MGDLFHGVPELATRFPVTQSEELQVRTVVEVITVQVTYMPQEFKTMIGNQLYSHALLT